MEKIDTSENSSNFILTIQFRLQESFRWLCWWEANSVKTRQSFVTSAILRLFLSHGVDVQRGKRHFLLPWLFISLAHGVGCWIRGRRTWEDYGLFECVVLGWGWKWSRANKRFACPLWKLYVNVSHYSLWLLSSWRKSNQLALGLCGRVIGERLWSQSCRRDRFALGSVDVDRPSSSLAVVWQASILRQASVFWEAPMFRQAPIFRQASLFRQTSMFWQTSIFRKACKISVTFTGQARRVFKRHWHVWRVGTFSRSSAEPSS